MPLARATLFPLSPAVNPVESLSETILPRNRNWSPSRQPLPLLLVLLALLPLLLALGLALGLALPLALPLPLLLPLVLPLPLELAFVEGASNRDGAPRPRFPAISTAKKTCRHCPRVPTSRSPPLTLPLTLALGLPLPLRSL